MLSSRLCCSSAFKDIQIGEKEFRECLNGEVNPLQAVLATLADPGSRSHKTNPIRRGLAVFRKGRGFPPPRFLHRFPIQEIKGREEQYFFPEPWHLALSDEQRQQYISTLLEKTQKFIQSSAFYRKPPPPNTKKSDIASCMHFLFSYTYIYICTYTYIYVCGRTHVYI